MSDPQNEWACLEGRLSGEDTQMAKRRTEGCQTPLVTREMQTRATEGPLHTLKDGQNFKNGK